MNLQFSSLKKVANIRSRLATTWIVLEMSCCSDGMLIKKERQKSLEAPLISKVCLHKLFRLG